MSSNTGGEGEIRRKLVEADLVECMVALPGQLFTNTQIPACIWFLTKDKKARTRPGTAPEDMDKFRNRSGEVLFIDARNMGYMKDRVLRDFKEEDIEKIAKAFHSWQCELPMGKVDMGNGQMAHVDPDPSWIYEDVPGFCKSATLEEIAKHDFVLTPGRYVGATDGDDDDEATNERIDKLRTQLFSQFEEEAILVKRIKQQLESLAQ
jgi:type I restriction enzyme M protein